MEEKEEHVLSQVKHEMKEHHINRKKQKSVLMHTRETLEKEKTMKLSIKEGSSSSAMSGFGDSYMTPFAIALNANNAQIGFLSAFSGLVSPLAQVFGSRLMEKSSRKKIIITAVLLQALMWLPIMFLGLMFWKNMFVSYLPVILIVFYSLYAILGSISGPSWFSLLGDIVPEKIRGKYFSKRNKICGSVAVLATIIAAFILDYFKTKGLILLGFSILFFLAFIFRATAAKLFSKHYEPKLNLNDGYYFSFFQFIKKAPYNNFGKFVIFVALIHFSIMIAGPFFAVYMLKDLGFSYITFMLINISASIFSLLAVPVWGRIADKYGNRETLRLTSILIPIIPIAWLFSANPLYLILVPQVISGIGWAGFNLATSNFIYDSVTKERRGLCVAYSAVLNGICIFLGASVGGLLAQNLTINFMNKLLFIFLLSGIVRAVIIAIFIPKIKEVREVHPRKKAYQYLGEFRPALHLRNLIPSQENIDLVLYHVKRIKFRKK